MNLFPTCFMLVCLAISSSAMAQSKALALALLQAHRLELESWESGDFLMKASSVSPRKTQNKLE